MKTLLITGGLGQMGIAVAMAARAKGYAVLLVGRSELNSKPTAFQAVVEEIGATYHSLDIYDPASEPELMQLGTQSHYWINAAEPYLAGQLDRTTVAQSLNYLYRIAAKAGYTTQNPAGKKFVRIGSPPAEIPRDGKVPKAGDFPESIPIAEQSRFHLAYATPYFQAKKLLAEMAKEAFDLHQVAVLSVCPTGLIGAYGNRSTDYEPMVRTIKGDFPTNLFLAANRTNVISVATAGNGIMLAAEKGEPGEVYQLSGPTLSTALPFQWALAHAFPEIERPGPRLKLKIPSFTLALLMAFPIAGLRSLFGKRPPWFLLPDFYALLKQMGNRSSEKAVQELGFVPDGEAEIRTAVKEAVEWYREIGLI